MMMTTSSETRIFPLHHAVLKILVEDFMKEAEIRPLADQRDRIAKIREGAADFCCRALKDAVSEGKHPESALKSLVNSMREFELMLQDLASRVELTYFVDIALRRFLGSESRIGANGARVDRAVFKWPEKVVGWQQVHIEILSPERAKLTAGSCSEILHFAELGFQDGRKNMTGKSILAWTQLCMLAQHGSLQSAAGKKRDQTHKAIKQLNQILENVFGLRDELAVESKKEVVGYKGLRKSADESSDRRRSAIYQYRYSANFHLSISPNYGR